MKNYSLVVLLLVGLVDVCILLIVGVSCVTSVLGRLATLSSYKLTKLFGLIMTILQGSGGTLSGSSSSGY